MARKYTQSTRIQKSYEVYQRNVENIKSKGIATVDILPFEKYKKIYQEYGKQQKPNIARDVAQQYNVVTTQREARDLYNKIREDFEEEIEEGYLDEDELYSVEELRKLSGQELWEYLKDLDYSDREAGARYDGDER